MFNVFNSVYFDTGYISAGIGSPGTFGDYQQVLGGPRNMQFVLKYIF
jgi:hypothetical protein